MVLMIGAWAMQSMAWANPFLAPGDWQRYRTTFVAPEGRVVDVGNGGISHSEGQGYGMLLAVAAGDRVTFERLWGWTQQNLQRDDRLFAWRWRPQQEPRVVDWNNATDGDLLIAWALSRAGVQWKQPEWTDEARRVAQRVRGSLVRNSSLGPVLVPAQKGFEEGGHITLNPAYWVFPALQTLARVDPDPVWPALIQSGQRLLELTRYGPAGVPPDWVRLTAQGHLSLPQDGERRRFGFEAVRIPLYLCWASLSDRTLMQGYLRAWPTELAPAWVDLSSGDRAAYPLTLAHRSMRVVAQSCETRAGAWPVVHDPADYYGSTLNLLARLTQTGFRNIP